MTLSKAEQAYRRARRLLFARLSPEQRQSVERVGGFNETICGRRYQFNGSYVTAVTFDGRQVARMECYIGEDDGYGDIVTSVPDDDITLVNLLLARNDLKRLWTTSCVYSKNAGYPKWGYMPYCRDPECKKPGHRKKA